MELAKPVWYTLFFMMERKPERMSNISHDYKPSLFQSLLNPAQAN